MRTEVIEPTPGEWVASEPPELGGHWEIVTPGAPDGGAWIIAEIHNGRPGDTLKTEGANARVMAASKDLLAVALAYEQWEADVLMSREAWANDAAAFPRLIPKLWDRLLEIQAMRNAAKAKALKHN